MIQQHVGINRNSRPVLVPRPCAPLHPRNMHPSSSPSELQKPIYHVSPQCSSPFVPFVPFLPPTPDMIVTRWTRRVLYRRRDTPKVLVIPVRAVEPFRKVRLLPFRSFSVFIPFSFINSRSKSSITSSHCSLTTQRTFSPVPSSVVLSAMLLALSFSVISLSIARPYWTISWMP